MLQTPQFTKLDTDPTKTTEKKVQNLLRKIKAQLPDKTIFAKTRLKPVLTESFLFSDGFSGLYWDLQKNC